jgi:hypothetical protein
VLQYVIENTIWYTRPEQKWETGRHGAWNIHNGAMNFHIITSARPTKMIGKIIYFFPFISLYSYCHSSSPLFLNQITAFLFPHSSMPLPFPSSPPVFRSLHEPHSCLHILAVTKGSLRFLRILITACWVFPERDRKWPLFVCRCLIYPFVSKHEHFADEKYCVFYGSQF